MLPTVLLALAATPARRSWPPPNVCCPVLLAGSCHTPLSNPAALPQVVAAPGRCAVLGSVCAVGGVGPGAAMEGGQPALVPGAARHHGAGGGACEWGAETATLLAAGCVVLSWEGLARRMGTDCITCRHVGGPLTPLTMPTTLHLACLATRSCPVLHRHWPTWAPCGVWTSRRACTSAA